MNNFLRRYERPNHLDNEQAIIEIKTIATAINKRTPAGLSQTGVGDRLDDAFQHVSENYSGRGWPKAAYFVKAMETIARHVTTEKPDDTWSLDPVAIAAKRMNAGNPVGDDWLFGRRCVELMATGEVSVETLRQYRSGWYFSAKDLYGEDKAREMEDAMLKRHEDAEATGAAMGQSVTKIPTYKPKTFGGEEWAAE